MIRPIVLLAVVSAVLGGSIYPAKKGILASTGPSDNPIATTAPVLPGGNVAVDAPPGPFFQGFQPPFPTDSWWSGFTVSNQDSVVAGPFPFQSATTNTGLMFGMADTRRFDGTSIHVDTQRDWTIGISGLPNDISHRKALSWDTQTVCLQYFNDAQNTMDSCLIPGSPYMTFTFNNAQVILTSNLGNVLSFEWITQGTKGKLTNEGGTYLVYVLGGNIQFTVAEKTLTSGAGFSGTLRFAKLKEASQEAILDQHANTYATGLTMGYTVAGDVATVTWTWSTVGNAADLLILSWPHHRKTLQGPNNVGIQYLTLKGQMKGVRGNVWTHRHTLSTISWFAQNAPQASCLPELIKTLEAEVNALEPSNPGDFYFWGGNFGAVARLALIAEHVGRNDLIDKVVVVLKESINHWFDPAHKPAAAFETGWGGFVNAEGWNNTWVDFGNAYYNDHHFHYGYLLAGAAVIGKYDPAWLNQHIDFLNHVARDVGNPSPNDPHYTVTRHLDFFAGHSWASGIANGAGPRDQESSGEAINGYYGLLLFAHASNNQALIDYSRLILAIEIAGAQEYWHLYPTINNPEDPYPEQEFRNLVTVGNVMDTQTGAWLFWGGQRIQIAAIQILPLTPIGQVTYDREWMEQVVPYCKGELDDPTIEDAFKSVIYAAYAKVNPQQAYLSSETLFDWGTGNTASNQLYFVSTQTSGQDICLAGSQTPEGLFFIQDANTNQFVVVAGNGQLAANVGASVLATKFTLKFTPGGSTIQGSNGKFVTASPDGTQALSAVRDTAASYEIFRWGAQGDTYELTAMVNKAQVSTGNGNGELLNNAGATSGITPSRYRLVEATEGGNVPVPAQGKIRSISANRYVVSTTGTPTLMVTGNGAGDGTSFSFEKVPESPAESPLYYIKNQVTNKYVTGDQAGSVPLAALREEAQGWEHFQIISYQNNFIILHVASGHASAVQPDNTIIDNNVAIDNTALFAIE